MSSLVQRPIIDPSSLRFDLPPASPIVNRSTTKIPPSNGSSFNASGRIIIDIPANGFLDSANTYLSFHSSITGGTSPAFQAGGVPWLRRLRISSGRNETIEDIQDYAAIEKMMCALTYHQDYSDFSGEIQAGYSNNNTNLVQYAAGKQFNVHLNLSGIFNSNKYWPLLITDGLRLEFYLDSINNVQNSSVAATAYTIQFVSMVCEFIDVSGEYLNKFLGELQQNGIRLHIPTYLTTQSSVSSASENIKITEAVRSIKSVWATLRETSSLSSATVNSVSTRQFDLATYQYRFGNKYLPQQPVECGGAGASGTEGVGAAEALSEVMKALNLHGGVDNGSQVEQGVAVGVTQCRWSDGQDGGGDGSDNTSECFVIGVNMELDPDGSLSGLDGNRRILDLSLVFADAPTNALTVSSYIYHDQICILDQASLHVVF